MEIIPPSFSRIRTFGFFGIPAFSFLYVKLHFCTSGELSLIVYTQWHVRCILKIDKRDQSTAEDESAKNEMKILNHQLFLYRSYHFTFFLLCRITASKLTIPKTASKLGAFVLPFSEVFVLVVCPSVCP